MSKYVLGHDLKGERTRVALMSQLLDPMHRRHIDTLGVIRPGARTLEVGCDNGSISAWLAERVRPGGALLLIEPHFLPVSVAEPPDVRAFSRGWLVSAREHGIDYTIGRALAPRLAALGLTAISSTAETAIYNGGSWRADYWIQTITELRNDLIA